MYCSKITNLYIATLLIGILSHTHFVLGILSDAERPFESRLKSDLLANYDSSVRPTYNVTLPTKVVADIALQQIIDVDEKQQLLRGTIWMRLYWTDEFIRWDPADYGGVNSLKFEPNKLWLPDICIYDALEPAIHANAMQDFYISVDNEGNIVWLSPIVVQSVCHLNVRYFPYDTQFCTLTVGSWMYHGLQVDLHNRNENGDTSSFKDNVEWEVKDFGVTRVVKIYNCCPEPYPVLDFTLTIQRRPGFYVTYLYIPSVVIIASSLFAFYLPPGSDAKVDLAVTGLLSQTVFLLLISDLMPPDAFNPPFLGQCLTILLVIQATAVVVIVIIKRVHDDSIYKSKPPGKMLFTAMHYLKYPFFMYHLEYRPDDVLEEMDSSSKAGEVNEAAKFEDEKFNNKDIKFSDIAISVNDVEAKFTNGHIANSNGNGVHMNGHSNKATLKINSFTSPAGHDDTNIETLNLDSLADEQTSTSPADSAILAALKTISREMEDIRERKKVTEQKENITEQWKKIAAMYDRILFVAFLICILGITLWFLTLQPTADSQRDQ